MNIDPDFIRMCAIVLGSPGAAPVDVEACRGLLASVRAEQSATEAEAHRAEAAAHRADMLPWPGVVLVIAWWLSMLWVLDRWASGRYLRRRPAPPRPPSSASSNPADEFSPFLPPL